MVEAIGIAIISAFTTSAALASAVAATTILGVSVGTIVGTAVVLGGSLLVSSLTTPDTRQKVQAQQFSTRQSLPPRRRAYGRTKLSGPKVEWKAYQGFFVNALYHVEGPIGGYDEVWFDDKKANLPAGSLSGQGGVLPWNEFVNYELHLGATNQTASPVLLKLPWWTTNDRLLGCAYSVGWHVAPEERFFSRVYPSGTYPEHRVVIRASLVRNINDPAQTSNASTWQWSDNPTLCIRDHITHQRWGMKVPETLIDDVSFKAKATSDAILVTKKDGTKVSRYFLGGAFDLTEQPADVLQGMLDACDGRLFLTTDGKIGISGGTYVAPDVTLRDPQIISVTIEKGSKKRASFNRMKISYVSPPHDYQVVEGDPWEDYTAQADSGEILETDFARPWVQDHNQLRRLAKIFCAKGNPEWRITGMVTDRSGLPAVFEDTIRLILTRYGIDAIFTVDRAIASSDGSTCTFDLTSLDPTCYTFNAATEEGIAPPLPTASGAAETIAVPTGLLASIERRAVGGSVNAVFLVLVASPPGRLDLSLIGRYRAVGTTAWTDMRADSDDRARVISDVLADGKEYEAQGALSGYDRAAQSAWLGTTPATITAVADPTAPNAPTYNSATLSADAANASHEFRQSDSPNARSVQILQARGVGKTITDASIVATVGALQSQVVTANTPIGLGLYRFYIKAVNGSGIVSAAAATSRTIINSMQPANLTTAPYDFTNAAWVKTRLGTPTIASNSPDSNASTLVPEQASANSHYVSQAVSITSGKRVQFAIGVRANGRTKGRIDLFDSSLVSYVRATFDLTAGTISVVSTSGSIISAGTAELTQVSSNWSIVSISGVVAATGVEGRLLFADDTGSASYTGDTTKGMYLWGGTIAMVN